MNRRKENLYRKVNTRALRVYHHLGSDAKYDRNTKKGVSKSMKSGIHRGLDYTPLFKFLLSRIGRPWKETYSESIFRLDKKEPIFYMVDIQNNSKDDYFNWENSKFSILIVDKDGLLQKKNPLLKNEDFSPSCNCCTYTFNGVILQNKLKI